MYSKYLHGPKNRSKKFRIGKSVIHKHINDSNTSMFELPLLRDNNRCAYALCRNIT